MTTTTQTRPELSKAEQKQARDRDLARWVRMYEEKGYHPDIIQVLAESQIRNADYSRGHVISYGGMYEKDPRLDQAIAELQNKNKAEIDQTQARIDELKQAIDQHKQKAREAHSKHLEVKWAQEYAWKGLAKKLKIHQYLTGSGSPSRAKLQRARDGRDQHNRSITEILTIYNKQYVPQVNQLVKEAGEKAKAENQVSDDERTSAQLYNQNASEYNQAVKRLNYLRGRGGLRG